MKYVTVVIATLGMVCYAGTAMTGSTPIAKQTTLGVPSYPGWTIHRLDDKADQSGRTHLYQYQYYSNDQAKQIVKFYEQHIGATASFMEPTYTHTINAPDGAIIQITGPPDGVPQINDDGRPTGRTWSSLITIIRFQGQ